MEITEIRPLADPAGELLPDRNGSPHRILVADDEDAIRGLIAAALVSSGYQVDAAKDGAAAWEALQAKPYDLLITDHNMPKVTGLELVKNLRSAHMAVPVVMVAGILPVEELASDPSLQVAATLPKPFAVSTLLDTVENVLRAPDSPREKINSLSNCGNQPSADGYWL
jgi:DNA-binding response OmpR family regulator